MGLILILWWPVGTWIFHSLLFHPSHGRFGELPAHVERVSYGQGLIGYLVRAPSPRRTVVFFHGNADRAVRGVAFARSLADEGADVLLAEYRGYGESAGSPTAYGVAADGEAAIRFLLERRHVSPASVVAIGQSLGGAVAVQALARHRLGRGILISTFTTLHDVSRALLGFPLSWTVPDAWALDSESAIRAVHAPLLVVHGDADPLIPVAVGRALYAAAPGPKTLRVVRGAGHNIDDPAAWDAVRAFAAQTSF